MHFADILEQAIDLLRRRRRLTYRTLQRQFQLDDAALADLKDALLFSQMAVDEDGRGLVWNDAAGTPGESGASPQANTERRFQAMLSAVIGLLRSERRLTYRTLKFLLDLDDMVLEDIRQELTLRRLAVDEVRKVLVWTGEPQSSGVSSASPTPQPSPTSQDAVQESVAVTHLASPEPLVSTTSSVASPDESARTSEARRPAPEAERRQLTVMFCDLADSTQLSQQLDPEDLRAVVRAYQTTAVEVVHRYEGHIAQYLGDGLLIYFGWPMAHEDDAQRALHAGLGIVEAITTTLNPRLEREHGVQLTVRLGVHTGPVVVGAMGSGGRHESLATGETVNIAARLEGLAAPNTVVISQVTARLVRGAFALEDLGAQVLKGVVEPLGVWRVLWPRDTNHEEEESGPDGATLLVGRDEEVGLLRRRWEQSKEGLGQVVLISGEAGIGKSALVSAIRTQVMAEGSTRLTYRCSPYHTNSTLYPVITHLEHMLGFEQDDTPETKLDKLEQILRTTNLPREESVPLVATLLSVPFEARYPAPTLSPQQHRQRTLDTLVGWLLHEAERRPVLTMWEDVHWADPSTLELLGLVLEQTPTVPILHVLTYRPEFDPPWPTRSHMTPITLNRLERPLVEALIARLAGGKRLPRDVSEHVVAKTDGVPLYVEELTEMFLRSDQLQEKADQYVLMGPLSAVAIPHTLQDSLMARLDQLGAAKQIAQLGAVLGREFSYALLRAIAPEEEATLQIGLAQLVEAELLYRRGRPPRATYIFKHALIQDAAYHSLLRSTRQQYHQRCVQAFVEHYPDIVTTQPELLAYHATQAGLHETAQRYWHQAGQRARTRSAYTEAVSHLTNSLASLARTPETLARRQQELAMQIELGPVLMATEGYGASEVAQAFRRAQVLCDEIGTPREQYHVSLGLRMFYQVSGALQAAYETGEHCLALAQRLEDYALLAMAHMMLSHTLFNQGHLLGAREHIEQTLAHYDQQQFHGHTLDSGLETGVFARGTAAWILWSLGYPSQAFQHAQESIRLGRTIDQPHNMEQGLMSAAIMSQLCQRVEAAAEQAEAAMAISEAHRFPMRLAMGQVIRGWAYAHQGQSAKGIALIRQGITGYRATGAETFVPYYLCVLAEVLWHQKKTHEGLTVLSEAFDLMEKNGERWREAELYRLQGALLCGQSEASQTEAERLFHKALDVARQQHAKSWELRAATSLARL